MTKYLAALSSAKLGAPSTDGIDAAMLKAANGDIHQHMLEGMNKILMPGAEVPKEWRKARIVLIPKDALLESLDYYGLGARLIDLISRLYNNCKSDMFLNHSTSSTFPINRGVRQGDTLSPLLFILILNPLLKWIKRGESGHQFPNGLTILVVAYCDDVALVGRKAEDLEESTRKLALFSAWAGLEVNPSKSAHTCSRASRPAVLRVPDTTSATGYMGVALNLDLNWAAQMAQTKNRVTKYLGLITHQRLSTDNRIYISNRSIITALKRSTRIPANMDEEPFLMAPDEGGRGLISLIDLQNAILCARTAQELASQALSSRTIHATWYHAFVYNNSHIGRWTTAIREMGWQAWPRTSDLDWVGHFVADPALAHALVSKGIFSPATALGEAERFQAKLQVLKSELWGPFQPWVEGNEGADRLAGLGHSKPYAVEPWTVPALADAVTIFDSDGHVIEDGSRDPITRSMGNFLHKARYGALPLKHTRHRLYWGKAEDGSRVARSPPTNTRSDRKRLTKWMARQIQFGDQTCHLCAAGAKETTAHVLGGECSLHDPNDLITGHKVRDLIRAQASSHSAYVDHIPLWFPHGSAPDSPFLLTMDTFSNLIV
ncbi:uncharacterized protein ACA1_113640 [Acanthamoeba castellanii str. Neff]|uniref:Reverse transcriptase domain-containing protein n=1 Tax=Acanthamoeba castellanii (strain ATCC 30010 / Neff) TaxID=1257118 RepID=L8H3C6_ACACF|nr:uncharacterized protein ACA1_113640 [Acanthamoeba castellanii str. Neff]ELR20019.1 hypothetical protein ACA1_113640 [Acanthamoeba castellanii str. Neff]